MSRSFLQHSRCINILHSLLTFHFEDTHLGAIIESNVRHEVELLIEIIYDYDVIPVRAASAFLLGLRP